MKRSSELKLIDLLSLRPGSLLSVHAIRGQVECRQAESFTRSVNWREEISNACFPNGDPLKIHNFSKLLEISVDAQIIVRFPDRKVLEILRLESNSWHTLLSHVGYHASVMVNGRVIAEGEIVNGAGQNGILINKVVGL